MRLLKKIKKNLDNEIYRTTDEQVLFLKYYVLADEGIFAMIG